MSVVIVNELQGGDQDMYDAVGPQVMPDGNLPDGCRVHVAGPIDGGWRVITVWDTEEQFNEFRDQRLIPALRDAGYADRVAPNVDARPVYKLISA